MVEHCPSKSMVAGSSPALRSSEDQAMPKPNLVTLTAPEKIWLQVSDEKSDRNLTFYPCEDVSWATRPVLACEVEYVRADLARAKRKTK